MDGLERSNCARKSILKRRPEIGGSLQVPGRKPFGHYRDEVEIIARMKSLRAAGWGFDSIADRLNADDVPSRSGKTWHGIVVNRILARAVREIDQPPFKADVAQFVRDAEAGK